MIVAYYYSDRVDSHVDAFECTTESEGILRLAGIMKGCSGTRPDLNRILDAAIENAKKDKTRESIQKLDTWVKMFNHGVNTFAYQLRIS